MESVRDWANKQNSTHEKGRGSGYGRCSGDGDGCGFGGFDQGFNPGIKRGYGDSNSCGYKRGFGDGLSYGHGSRYDDGDSGCDLILSMVSINIKGHEVFNIDLIPTIIYKHKGNVAHGAIVREDMTLVPCYIVRDEGVYAHGKTLAEARTNLLEKIFFEKPETERIEEFIKQFPKNKPQSGAKYYKWHHLLTGSCKMGRDEFVRSKGLDLSKEYTPAEFIQLTKGSYGGEIIEALEREYQRNLH